MLHKPLPIFGFIPTVVMCTISVFAVACTSRQTTDPKAVETYEAQARINEYFHRDVIPKLETCWGILKGEGTITIAHHYELGPERTWVPKELDVEASTLSDDQNQAALSCMRQAVDGTSFPLDPSDAMAKEHILFWTWPVPLPDDKVVFKGKGCDGQGTPAYCSECSWGDDWDEVECIRTCVGWWGCSASGNSCTIVLDRCASGGPYGFSSFGTGSILAP